MQDFANRFYKSRRWRDCRRAYIAKRLLIDGGLCEECREAPGFIVHHRVKLTPENINNPSIALNHSLLAYVCKDCHDDYDGHGLNKAKRLICDFAADGQPIDNRRI